jgi:hypothetical protein
VGNRDDWKGPLLVTEHFAPLLVGTALGAAVVLVAAVLTRTRQGGVAHIPTSSDPEEIEAYWRDYHRRQQEISRRYAIQIPIFVLLIGLFVSLLQLI